jgi:hypothetical protein
MPWIWQTRQWLGVPSGQLWVAMLPEPRVLTLVAIRDNPLRVVAAAETELAPGDVRGTRIRLVGAVADALSRTRTSLNLPVGAPMVGLFEPMTPAFAGAPADPSAPIRRSERVAFERTCHEGGFVPAGFISVPDAAARVPSTPRLRGVRRQELPARYDLVAAAGVAAANGTLPTSLPEVDDDVPPDTWTVESIGDLSWA